MSTSLINGLGGYVQSVLESTLPKTSSQNTLTGTGTASLQPQADSAQVSPFAQLLNTLQQLQQNDPAKYRQVTQQISTNLQSAAQTAQSSGNTAAATQLNQLAADFSKASTSGQLPNVQDLAKAIGGHGHHHHHGHAAASGSSPQTAGAASDSLDPAAIIANTLASA